jgi:hypothetical protein
MYRIISKNHQNKKEPQLLSRFFWVKAYIYAAILPSAILLSFAAVGTVENDCPAIAALSCSSVISI